MEEKIASSFLQTRDEDIFSPEKSILGTPVYPVLLPPARFLSSATGEMHAPTADAPSYLLPLPPNVTSRETYPDTLTCSAQLRASSSSPSTPRVGSTPLFTSAAAQIVNISKSPPSKTLTSSQTRNIHEAKPSAPRSSLRHSFNTSSKKSNRSPAKKTSHVKRAMRRAKGESPGGNPWTITNASSDLPGDILQRKIQEAVNKIDPNMRSHTPITSAGPQIKPSTPSQLSARSSPGPNRLNWSGRAPPDQGRYTPSSRMHEIDQASSGQNGAESNSRVKDSENDWRNKASIGLKFFNFPVALTTTKQLWNIFSQEGTIIFLELYTTLRGGPTGSGLVKFSPVPKRAFWLDSSYRVQFPGSPIQYTPRFQRPTDDVVYKGLKNSGRKYPETMELVVESVNFGVTHKRNTMLSMFKASPIRGNGVTFTQNLKFREVGIHFPIMTGDKTNPISLYKLQISMAQPVKIYQVVTHGSTSDVLTFFLTIETPPACYRKWSDHKTLPEADQDNFRWTENDSWFRATDIAKNLEIARKSSTGLKKLNSVIDLGRWLTYRLVIDKAKNGPAVIDEFFSALQDFNIEVISRDAFALVDGMNGPVQTVWDLIEPTQPSSQRNLRFSEELFDEGIIHLPSALRYQLEACISNGTLCEYNLGREFLQQLLEMDRTHAIELLEQVLLNKYQEKIWFNPMEVFSTIPPRAKTRSKLPHYCILIRTAVVTPTTVHYSNPSMDISNRVIRHYAEHGDRFLRVRFTDEKVKGKIFCTDRGHMNEVFTRIKRTMMNGIVIGDMRYEFLAFGNSQFREHGAYFFAPVAHLSAARIRRWMGNFEDINIVAKYAARLGQCFSTTRAIRGANPTIVETEDYVSADGRCTFTDGVGIISQLVAQIAFTEVGVPSKTDSDVPSLLQFRLGGSKGVLAVWPSIAKGKEIHIRPSQYKFHAEYEGLEVVRWSQFSGSNLNRQLITVLSTLGVSHHTFLDMLRDQLSGLHNAMTDERVALSRLQDHVDPNQMVFTLSKMILDGFQRTKEPFLISLLHLWRAWSIKYLKEKARLAVRDGAVLLGCIDETGLLQGHFDNPHLKEYPPTSEQERINALPEVFVQVQRNKGPLEDRSSRLEVLKGVMILARNPSLHPGDIRVVRGVDIPELHHMKDCIVLPRTGDKDLAGMCSGGDLDGDDYVIIWDKNLIPPEWNYTPMDFTPLKPDRKGEGESITVDDITSFFVNFMKNDTLPAIAQAHLALADQSPDGVKDLRCIELAALHSAAVDYAKTGANAVMPIRLRPKRWPHFMERKNNSTYHSDNVLGKLYDQIERVEFTPAFDLPFDQRILTAYTPDDSILEAAADIKLAYDQDMRRIMLQHDIATEVEVWSTFVMHHTRDSKDYNFHEEIGRIAGALKERYQEECIKVAGGKDFEVIGPFVAAMYKVTSDEMSKALKECSQMTTQNGVLEPVRVKSKATMPMMSFPWIFPEILGRIALGDLPKYAKIAEQQAEKVKRSKPKFIPGVRKAKVEEDVLKTKKGEVHRGETLVMFDSGDEKQSPQRESSRDQEPIYSKPAQELLGLDFSVSDQGSASTSSGSYHNILDTELGGKVRGTVSSDNEQDGGVKIDEPKDSEDGGVILNVEGSVEATIVDLSAVRPVDENTVGDADEDDDEGYGEVEIIVPQQKNSIWQKLAECA